MPRQARIDAPGALHHVIARGIERGTIFQDDADREDFLSRLEKIVLQTRSKCYAWALIPNHLHLLLKTGSVPVAGVMRRLLTGYASGYNRRHRRIGHLFQNRYKSILCQEDAYLKELVRYIHLNPLRAGVVKEVEALDQYPYSGHSAIMGEHPREWQSTRDVLVLFSKRIFAARQKYHDFVIEGIGKGRRPDLIGGGLLRSAGGWAGIEVLRSSGVFQKSDERILGDGDFVARVLAEAEEQMDRSYSFKAKGITLHKLQIAVAGLLEIDAKEIIGPSKVRAVGRARNVFCYWAVRELDFSMTQVSKHLRVAVPTVSVAVQKGGAIIEEKGWALATLLEKLQI